MKANKRSGYTLIELMMVILIMSVLASIAAPRFVLLEQKAYQATTKNNLGVIRSSLGLYYSANEGLWPLKNNLDGYASDQGISLSETLVPLYLERIPLPKLLARVPGYNGFAALNYDAQSKIYLEQTPPLDVYISREEVDPVNILLIDRPYAYNPEYGTIYLCNDNFDSSDQYFCLW